ncbi:MAG TPA: folylpolyglutamate synthase/dihydrofolate synthase family protein [Sphingomicrobium sp.]|nr:folylpolyglutamate synthase/dihydrofolate synthase family protein [Sphingomicrobium sp.]
MADFARSQNAAVQAQLDRLQKLSPGGDSLGLERISKLLERLGRPQDKLPPVFHVAGTNGKGSTCAFLRAILEAAGLKVHMFTSPHLVRFNERIRIRGELIDDASLAKLLERVLDESEEIEPTFFEATTAAALLAFSEEDSDACVIEVGLGGRLDATNVIEQPLVCGIAGLGLDHRQWLGSRVTDIAAEKAGIAKPDVPIVTQRYRPLAAQQVQQRAEAVGARWIGRGALWDMRLIRDNLRYRDRGGGLKLPMPGLPGRHQADNAALAVAMLRHQDRLTIPEEAFADGILNAQWHARLQKLGEGPLTKRLPKGSELWVDGGHNAMAGRMIADFARRSLVSDMPLVLFFASLKSKSPRAILKPFADIAETVHMLPIEDHDHHSPGSLAKLAKELGFTSSANKTINQALGRVKRPSRLLVFGSLYLAGEMLGANEEIPD